ncbi:MAG: sugar phosphate isomerase/epimerase family protein [Bryobacteraceae bacterium]|nr:sugar phosphate isomerase/epimerase family protein [Bryobacteraceae bacterium]
MLIGAMNHPAQDVISEIRWMAEMRLDFIDLTLEPPAAAVWLVNGREVRDLLASHNMTAVGHTAYYLPFASAFESVRCAAVDELRRCLDVFAEVGVKWMNLHPDRHTPMHDRGFYIGRNLQSIHELQQHAEDTGVGLMIENLPGDFNSAPQLGELLEAVPELGLHLDIGHANLIVPHNTTGEILHAWGSRLRHVHLHDNKGGHADLHLPLGAGTLDVRQSLKHLIDCGFDGTITLEVFTPDRHFFAYSRDVLRRMWDELKSSSSTAAAR